ncbi:hypothetical protein ABI59_10985 [Acidobacteria bacterium Mor1]|nr:hypothetical protein ABI59_10985 [Acidobacteria bacterium Mor1]
MARTTILLLVSLLAFAACGPGKSWDELNKEATEAVQGGDAEAAATLLEEALQLARDGGDPDQIIKSLTNLGDLYTSRSDLPKAVTYFEQAFAEIEKKLGEDHIDLAKGCDSLGRHYRNLGRADEALAMHTRGLEIREKHLEPNAQEIADSLNNVGAVLIQTNRPAEALPMIERAVGIWQGAMAAHPKLGAAYANMAQIRRAQGDVPGAIAELEKAVEVFRQNFGPRDPRLASTMHSLGKEYHRAGRLDEAERTYRNALSIREEVLGARHVETAHSMTNLGMLMRSQRRPQAAEPLYVDALSILREQLGNEHRDVASGEFNLGVLYASMGRFGEAEPLFKSSLATYETNLGDNHPTVAMILRNYVELLRQDGRADEAAPFEARLKSIAEGTADPA